MARRLDWEKQTLMSKRKQSISDEKEFMSKDLAAKWLERREERTAQRPFKDKRRKGERPKFR